MDASTPRTVPYRLLLWVTLGMLVGRIVGIENAYDPSLYHQEPRRTWPAVLPKPTPSFGSNDRSRWSTVLSLAEHGTFVIGKRIADPADPKGYRDVGPGFDDARFRSIDVMMNPDTKEFFSTKPPVLTVMAAGEYWLLRQAFGWSLVDDPWPPMVTILITFNVLPMLLSLWLLTRFLERFGATDAGKLYVFAAACFGTFLTTFSVTFNNHVPAACCVMFAAAILLRETSPGAVRLLFAGLFAGLAVTFDLPSAVFAAGLGLWAFGRCRWRGLWLVFGGTIALGALIACNYLAIGEWSPGYSKFGTVWYEYEGSHWLKAKQVPPPAGIDFAAEPKDVYAFHMLLGHHGLFSLTPIWILSVVGIFLQLRDRVLRPLAVLTLVSLLVVIGFYVFKTNNYGGYTAGPRWQFWLTPLLLLTLVPVADRLMVRRWGRWLAGLFLAISAFSVYYPVSNPWRHPWPLRFCEYMGWLKY